MALLLKGHGLLITQPRPFPEVLIQFDFQFANNMTETKTITPTPMLSMVLLFISTINNQMLLKIVAVTIDKRILVNFFINVSLLLILPGYSTENLALLQNGCRLNLWQSRPFLKLNLTKILED